LCYDFSGITAVLIFEREVFVMDKDLAFLKEIFKLITDLFKELFAAFRGGSDETTEPAGDE
jgi:hypothetical protein